VSRQCEDLPEISYRFSRVASSLISSPAVEVSIGMMGVQCCGLGEIDNGTVKLPSLSIDSPAVAISCDIVGLQRDSLGEVSNCFVMLPLDEVDAAAVEVRLYDVGVVLNGPAIVGKGQVVFTDVNVHISAIIIGCRIVWLQRGRLIIVVQSMIIVPLISVRLTAIGSCVASMP
jgi:hypothetical protein